MKKLTLSLVTYNSERYLTEFAHSLTAQTFTDMDVIVIDNNSSDNSAARARELLPHATVIKQNVNLGFARAHNLAIAWSKTPSIAVVNPDILMHVDCIERLMQFLETYPRAGVVGPLLLTWKSIHPTEADRIDTAGLTIARNFHVTDRLHGARAADAHTAEVFGISGSFAVYRRDALESVREPRGENPHTYEYFDENFFMYKEDVDLSWRLLNAGWKQYCVADARGYHNRTIAQSQNSWVERKARGEINRYSYRNNILMLVKNLSGRLTLRYLLPMMLFELQKFIYLAALDRSSLTGFWEALRLLPSTRIKRKYLALKIVSREAVRPFLT